MTQANQATALEAINTALHDAMAADDKVLVLGEDIGDVEEGGVMGATKGLSTKFGDHRVRSTPISEQAIVGAAIGASLRGYRPVAEIMFMNFTTVCMDMIINHAAKLRFMSGGKTNVPITIRCMTGTGFGVGGQHSDYLEAWYAHTPGIKIVAPSNSEDAYGLLRAAIEDDDPVIFVENLPGYFMPSPFENREVTPIGTARIAREGQDVSIITHSRMVHEATAAADQLQGAGISAEIIDLRSISPWDQGTVVESVRKTRCGIVVHEAVREFGIGAEIASHITEHLFGDLKAPITRLGAAYSPVPFSKPLEDAYTPNATKIAEAATRLVSGQTG